MRWKRCEIPGQWRYAELWKAVAATMTICCIATGCSEPRVGRFDLTGQVTYRGQPVPKGYMIFTPDREKGNSGPAAKSTIVNGQYETIKGLGVVGGPHVVSIVGTDGVPYDQGEGVMNPMGRPMFPEYKAHVDLPKESGTFNFEVPAEQVK
jgi:hypothetical protein